MKWLDRASLALRGGLTLGETLERLARLHGDRVVVDQGVEGRRFTYREAADTVTRWAGWIAERTEPGDRVVVGVPNSYEMFLLCVAASRAGGLPVPVNPQMSQGEIEHVIADSGATLVIDDLASIGDAAPLREGVPAEEGDVAAIFYSSGTTGKPKGARLTHRALLSQARSGALYPAGLRRDEAVIGLPIAHIMGFVVVLGLATAGIPVYFLPRFRPDEVLDAIERRRSTIFIGVPAMYRLLLEAGAEDRNLRSVRVWGSGADVMPQELARRFQRMGATATLPVLNRDVGEAFFVEGYGMVEVGGGVAAKFLPPGLAGPLADVLGVPLPPYRFKVVDEDDAEVGMGQVGELLVKGPGVLQGYHGDPDATKAVLTDDGWLRTGDLVRRGPFGLVSFAGRGKDVIKAGGYSVYALEVQDALEGHASVAEAAVVGVPDERMGERVVAAIRLLPGAAASEDELIAWCRERLSSYKVPAAVRIVDELPRTGTEKVKKAEVRDMFAS
ncbi:MAG TPA: AMP-binding protein [Acidimicrobiales bacterium]|jgi:acyl-CoA synthetase (AMP-forming)/AMP-acid ligase II|nr:AMP-binding protein [Acidimicrobiales bacterium]